MSPVLTRRECLLRAAGGLALAAGAPWARAASSRLQLGQPAPALVLRTLDGRSIATHALHGKVVVVSFWATWCPHCIDELPLLSKYAEQHADQGLTVLAFSLDSPDALPEVKRRSANLSFPTGLLGSAWAGEYGRIWRLPVSFVIDRAGRLVDNGWDDEQPVWTPQRLKRVLDPLLVNF